MPGKRYNFQFDSDEVCIHRHRTQVEQRRHVPHTFLKTSISFNHSDSNRGLSSPMMSHCAIAIFLGLFVVMVVSGGIAGEMCVSEKGED